jgi:adenylyltransferase/sulfurtransferase
MPKVESAKAAIAKLNPDVKVIGHQTRLDSSNVLDIIKDYDVIVDGADNFPTRLPDQRRGAEAGQAADRRQHLPLRGHGHDVPAVRGSLLPLLLSAAAAPGHGAVCQEAGVLGVLCGVHRRAGGDRGDQGAAGQGQAAVGRELHFDALAMKFREFKRAARSACPVCGEGRSPRTSS